MTTWLVTGASGFLGRHVLDRLLAEAGGDRIVALHRRPVVVRDGVEWAEADLSALEPLGRLVRRVRPDKVLHLAGVTPPADPERCFRGNTAATSNLLRALGGHGRRVRLVAAGSAAELGRVPRDRLPAREELACRPEGAYGISKWAAARLVLDAPDSIESVVARMFNLVGPGMPRGQVFGRFAEGLSRAGPGPLRLRVGGLEARRDFVDVRDAAGAIVALARTDGLRGVFNVGSGRSREVGEGLAALIRLSGRVVVLQRDEERGRGPSESRASIDRITGALNWRPTIPLERSLGDHWGELAALTRLALPDRAAAV